jgi:propionyl-CoA carboxylase alpha chain
VPSGLQEADFSIDGERVEVRYRLGRGTVEVAVGDKPLLGVTVFAATGDGVDLEVDGVRRTCRVHRSGDVFFVDSVLGATTLVEEDRFPEPGSQDAPGSLLAPMPGTVVRIAAEPGATVSEGQTVVVLEAMKMEHSVKAPVDGTVSEIGVVVGQSVDLGTVLAIVEGLEDDA